MCDNSALGLFDAATEWASGMDHGSCDLDFCPSAAGLHHQGVSRRWFAQGLGGAAEGAWGRVVLIDNAVEPPE